MTPSYYNSSHHHAIDCYLLVTGLPIPTRLIPIGALNSFNDEVRKVFPTKNDSSCCYCFSFPACPMCFSVCQFVSLPFAVPFVRFMCWIHTYWVDPLNSLYSMGSMFWDLSHVHLTALGYLNLVDTAVFSPLLCPCSTPTIPLTAFLSQSLPPTISVSRTFSCLFLSDKFINRIETDPPDLLILMGPFVDTKNKIVSSIQIGFSQEIVDQ